MPTSVATTPDVRGRFASQLLTGTPARDVATVVDRILAVQAQDLPAARLAIRSRSTGLISADVDRALTVDRTHCITWLNRGTLHLVSREDYWWLQLLTAPTTRTANEKRLAQEGASIVGAERAMRFIKRWLSSDGPMTRLQIGERLAAKGIRTQGQALVHTLMYASLRGHIVRGPVIGREQGFVSVRDWWGSPPKLDRDEVLAKLARRYLAGHAPANERDLAKWSGLPLRDVRRGLSLIAADVNDFEGQLSLKSQRLEVEVPKPKLLGSFDPVLMGWVDRGWVLGDARHVVTANGMFLAFAMVNGVASATWRRQRGEVVLEHFAEVPPKVAKALAREATDLDRFLTPKG